MDRKCTKMLVSCIYHHMINLFGRPFALKFWTPRISQIFSLPTSPLSGAGAKTLQQSFSPTCIIFHWYPSPFLDQPFRLFKWIKIKFAQCQSKEYFSLDLYWDFQIWPRFTNNLVCMNLLAMGLMLLTSHPYQATWLTVTNEIFTFQRQQHSDQYQWMCVLFH